MEKFLHVLWIIGLVVAGIVGLIVLVCITYGVVYLFRRAKYGKEYDEFDPKVTKTQFLANHAILGKPKIAWILPYHDLDERYLPDPISSLFNPKDNLKVVPNEDKPGSIDFNNCLCVKLEPSYTSGTFIEATIDTKNVSDDLIIGISYLSIAFLDENHEYLFDFEGGQTLREEYEEFLNNELSKCAGSEAKERVKNTALSDFLNSFRPYDHNYGNFSISFDDIDAVRCRKVRYFSCDLEFYVFYRHRHGFKYVGVKHYDDIEFIDDLEKHDMSYSDYRRNRFDSKKDYVDARFGTTIPRDRIDNYKSDRRYSYIRGVRNGRGRGHAIRHDE